MFLIRWHNLYNYYHGTEYRGSTVKYVVDVLQLLLKVPRENSYNNSGKFEGIYNIGSSFHIHLQLYSVEVLQINNGLTMELMKRIV